MVEIQGRSQRSGHVGSHTIQTRPVKVALAEALSWIDRPSSAKTLELGGVEVRARVLGSACHSRLSAMPA